MGRDNLPTLRIPEALILMILPYGHFFHFIDILLSARFERSIWSISRRDTYVQHERRRSGEHIDNEVRRLLVRSGGKAVGTHASGQL